MFAKLRLKQLIKYYDKAITIKESFYELDTIERLIVPVLRIAGWKTDSVLPLFLKRDNGDNRSSNQTFDLQLFVINDLQNPKFVFECKRLEEDIIIEGKGASCNTKDPKDFIRQMRNYCTDGTHVFKNGYSIPVLTNGFQWVVFTREFVCKNRINENINGNNRNDFILSEAKLNDPDFDKKIIGTLRKENQ